MKFNVWPLNFQKSDQKKNLDSMTKVHLFPAYNLNVHFCLLISQSTLQRNNVLIGLDAKRVETLNLTPIGNSSRGGSFHFLNFDMPRDSCNI